MNRIVLGLIAAVFAVTLAQAQVPPFPPEFKTQEIATNGVTIHVRVGGSGPAVVLLHGYGETGDMWAPLAADLMRDHTVVVPDLRGMGLSSKPEKGYEKKLQAGDIAGVLDTLNIKTADLVTHDIGNMVGFAFAAFYPGRTNRWVLIDAPVPGVGPWDEILKNPLLWHFRFGGPDMERLVEGRERIYLDRFWNEFSHDPARFKEESRAHYAQLYAQPGAMHGGFGQFAAFDQDAIDNRAFLATNRLTMPILALGGEFSFGKTMAQVMRFAADNVQEGVIADSGHWIMEENPTATIAAVRAFLNAGAEQQTITEVSLSRTEIEALTKETAGEDTAAVDGTRTVLLSGDPTKPGPYAIELLIPANTQIAAHTHKDERFATVVSGTWYVGYGRAMEESKVKELKPGSFYTEPAGEGHFGLTRDKPVVLHITGFGPTNTTFLDPRP